MIIWNDTTAYINSVDNENYIYSSFYNINEQQEFITKIYVCAISKVEKFSISNFYGVWENLSTYLKPFSPLYLVYNKICYCHTYVQGKYTLKSQESLSNHDVFCR